MDTRPDRVQSTRISLIFGAKPRIDGYEILDEIGSGQWARVHLARHVRTGRFVACKTLRESVWHDYTIRKRFTREHAIPRMQRHPNILENLEADESNGWPYIIMPYCAGGNLEQERVRHGGRLSAMAAFRLMSPAMAGLAALHAQNFVHRDIKPQNILLDARGVSFVADFGLAKSISEAGSSGITSSSMVGIGSLGFMPPEQVGNFRFLNARTDVWAAAATYAYLITGAPVREMSSRSGDFTWILRRPAIPLRQRDATISRNVATIVDRALLDDVDARYANAATFWRALQRAVT